MIEKLKENKNRSKRVEKRESKYIYIYMNPNFGGHESKTNVLHIFFVAMEASKYSSCQTSLSPTKPFNKTLQNLSPSRRPAGERRRKNTTDILFLDKI